MAKFNADAKTTDWPLEIRLGGKDYVVEKITHGQWNKAWEAAGDNPKTVNTPAWLAVILGGKTADFEELPGNQVSATFNFIVGQYGKGLGLTAKNGSGAGSESTPKSPEPAPESTG